MNKWRRFLYLVVDEFGATYRYPLRRIDSSTLFFPRNQQVKEAATILEETPLPRPQLSFTTSRGRGSLEFIGLFGNGRKKSHLAAVEYGGVSHIYDVERRTMQEIASPKECQFLDPVTLAVGDSLYVMDRETIPGHTKFSFEVLDHALMCNPNSSSSWHCLQPLPFAFHERRSVGSYTTSDGAGSNILVSAPGVGTYSLDVSSCSSSWRKAGDWELPFRGRADFFPEYGVWLGFSSQDNLLCCSSDITAQGAPSLDMVWEDLDPPRRWIPRKSHLVYLGSNKFCVAKLFERKFNILSEEGSVPNIDTFAVFTGLVLKPSTDHSGLVMLKHRSHIYRFSEVIGFWVF